MSNNKNLADEILRKHEDSNEMHFHDVDRQWIIEAMEEYSNSLKETKEDELLERKKRLLELNTKMQNILIRLYQ